MNRHPNFANFGEYLYWSYANLQMLFFAIKKGIPQYNQQCFMIRAKAFKAYKDGRWHINDLLSNNVAKIKSGDFCWYCGKEFDSKDELTIDHVFPRSKGGDNSMNNIIMVCKHCNSSKGNMDLFEWYFMVRHEWPPIYIMVHYLKQIYQYAIDNKLLELHQAEINGLHLPFNYRYIPLEYPQPEMFM